MGYIDPKDLEWVIENKLEFFVFEKNRLADAIEIAKRIDKKALVHVEIETGMNRTGFPTAELDEVFSLIKANQPYIKATGICTHFAGAESSMNHPRVKKQQSKFNKVLTSLKKQNQLPKLIHSACSAAVIAYPKSIHNMVRIGIMQYGFYPNKEMLINYRNNKKKVGIEPKRVLSWKSTIMDIKEVKSGEFIGYGTSYLTNSPNKIAIIPVGYAMGLDRTLSNLGKVLIGGQRLNIIGTIYMNSVTVNITNVEDIAIGDEVVLIGKQGGLEISVSSFSDPGNLPNYELLTRLPCEIPRVIVE